MQLQNPRILYREYVDFDFSSICPLEDDSAYTSIDPAPPLSRLLSGQPKPDDLTEASISSLKEKLLNVELPLFERYRAMFALRNIGTPSAVDALAGGFSDDSALFK